MPAVAETLRADGRLGKGAILPLGHIPDWRAFRDGPASAFSQTKGPGEGRTCRLRGRATAAHQDAVFSGISKVSGSPMKLPSNQAQAGPGPASCTCRPVHVHQGDLVVRPRDGGRDPEATRAEPTRPQPAWLALTLRLGLARSPTQYLTLLSLPPSSRVASSERPERGWDCALTTVAGEALWPPLE